VSIDAVLVPEQTKEDMKGRRLETEDGKNYIDHWNARDVIGGMSMFFTATDEEICTCSSYGPLSREST